MSWKRVCELAELAENEVKRVTVDGVPILIVSCQDVIRAMPPVCPHMEEPLEESAVVSRCVMTCTKHLWAWDLRNLEMRGEAEKPLKTYEVKIEDGAVFALVDQELTYEFDDEADELDDFFCKS